MDEKNLVSVAIITRHTPLMILKRCIESVRKQTYPNIEILLLDANDTSSSYKKALQSEADLLTNLIYIEHTERNEYTFLKNQALQKANGTYLLFLSAQDTMPSKRLECVINYFHSHSNVDAIATDMNVQTKDTLEKDDYALSSSELQYIAQLVMRKTCTNLLEGFDNNLVAHVDDEFILKLQQNHSLHHLSNPETIISINTDFYNEYTFLQSAIGYRQIATKYITYFKKNKQKKRALYFSIAHSYKRAHLFFRYLQFAIKGLVTAPFQKKRI